MYAIGLTDVSTIGEVCLLYYFPFVFVIFIEKELLETLESRLDRGLVAFGYCLFFLLLYFRKYFQPKQECLETTKAKPTDKTEMSEEDSKSIYGDFFFSLGTSGSCGVSFGCANPGS